MMMIMKIETTKKKTIRPVAAEPSGGLLQQKSAVAGFEGASSLGHAEAWEKCVSRKKNQQHESGSCYPASLLID